MTGYTMTIGGQPATTPATLKVVNPATGKVFAEVPDCTRGQLDAAMEKRPARLHRVEGRR